MTVPTCDFTAPAGKKFAGWDFDDTWYLQPGREITFYVDTTLKAVWEDVVEDTITITYDANGGTGTMADATGISGEYELPACTFTAPSGKQFKAWSVGGAEKAVGVDIDKLAVKTAIENGKMNGFEEPKLKILNGNLTDKVTGKFDVIVANIVADIIIMFTKDVATKLEKREV